MDTVAMNAWLQQFHSWHEFYLLVGTSVAALTGLMFVVVSIGPEVITRQEPGGVRAFVTPTVVYFTTVLIVSGVMMMPRIDPVVLGVLLLIGSVAGLVYIFWTGVHWKWRENKLGWDDFIGYVTLPLLGYALMLAAGIGMWVRSAFGPYALAAAVLLLTVVGIRNAWDLILWFARKRG